ncbi:MAG TPA: hypothetical protein VER11_32070 [Polyangiaceae bacterium]|nr:hypothetical protein [Polyangiaceae bacterium]
MRWRFPDPNDVPETERRTASLLAIDRFWQQFVRTAPELSKTFANQAELDIAEFMLRHLSVIDQRLMWEYGPAVRGDGHRLVVTPESARELRPLVDVLLSRAPAVPSWEFYAHRLPEDLETALATVDGRTEIDVSGWQAEVIPAEHHLLDLKWIMPPGTHGENLQYAAYVASEALLGEEVLNTWVAEINVEERARPSALGRLLGSASARSESVGNLDSLQARVNTAIAVIDSALPALPHSSIDQENGVEYTLFSLEPEEQDDYAGRFDLFTSISSLPQMWQAAHSNLLFSSRRFSKHGETFCYVKLDGRDSGDHGDVSARGRIEDALNAALRPNGLGSVIGGGTGRRYTYIDLAIRHLDHGLSEVRRVLREVGVPERSWLLFFDAHLAEEWLGIYDTTPAPPSDEADETDETDETDED